MVLLRGERMIPHLRKCGIILALPDGSGKSYLGAITDGDESGLGSQGSERSSGVVLVLVIALVLDPMGLVQS